MNVELLVGNETGTRAYLPAVAEGIEWTTERKGAPGKLVFKVLKDGRLDFSEGSAVRMKVDGQGVFLQMPLRPAISAWRVSVTCSWMWQGWKTMTGCC